MAVRKNETWKGEAHLSTCMRVGRSQEIHKEIHKDFKNPSREEEVTAKEKDVRIVRLES